MFNLVFQDIDDDEFHPDNLGVGVTVVGQVNQLTVVQQLIILCSTFMLKVEERFKTQNVKVYFEGMYA